jgi:hypothetical protein
MPSLTETLSFLRYKRICIRQHHHFEIYEVRLKSIWDEEKDGAPWYLRWKVQKRTSDVAVTAVQKPARTCNGVCKKRASSFG